MLQHMYMVKKMRKIIIILLVFLVLFTLGCDTELGHGSEDHDHDGDGIPDHAAEEHVDEEHDELEEHIILNNE